MDRPRKIEPCIWSSYITRPSMDDYFANIHDSINYIEIQCISKTLIADQLYDTSFSQAAFQHALNQIQKTHYKKCQKRYKRFMMYDAEYHHYQEQEKFTVFKKKLLHMQPTTKGHIVCHYKKDTLLPYKFAWSDKLHDIDYVTRITFKLNNRLFFNMEAHHTSPKDTKPTYTMYFNYNHAPNVEASRHMAQVNQIMELLNTCA